TKPADTIGGIKGLWFIPVDDVASFGDVILNELQSITLLNGKSWKYIYSIYSDREFYENKKENKEGISFEKSFKAFFPGYSVESLLQFEEMKYTRFCIAYQDNNYLFKLTGTINNPLNFRYKLITGSTGADNSGVEFEFYGNSKIRILEVTNEILHVLPITYTDWFLPSIDELQEIKNNLYNYGLGSFNSGYYWSSSEYDAISSYCLDFTGSASVLEKTETAHVRACRSFTDVSGKYNLRDIGPAGGLIFYIDDTTYYEAAPIDIERNTFSNITDKAIRTTETAIGTGATNTAAIIEQASGANDWFLPSKNEIAAMYNNLKIYGLGNFTNNFYWTSSEYNASYGVLFNFSDGTNSILYKNSSIRIRPCRKFTSLTQYSLRDIGPAGGLIFYIDGNNYYESNLYDLVGIWSNVYPGLIGTTSANIGEGLNNTNEIIAQAGHIDSSAKLCLDYDNRYAHSYSAAKLCNDLEITA
ncbi:MAG TPA: hypothetical protein DCP51_02720, partial [Clostridiales bacterium]|nr:hypothetical protein [Clostridiales bacterium]